MPQRDIDDPDLSLAELFRRWPNCARVFLRYKMGCFGCLVAPFHCVTDACHEYHRDELAFRTELHATIAEED